MCPGTGYIFDYMMRLAYPENIVFLVLLAIVIWLAVAIMKDRDVRLRALGDLPLIHRLIRGHYEPKFRWKLMILVASCGCMWLALIGIEVGSKYEKVTIEGVDVVIALDISTSMNAQDVKPSRLEKAKHKVGALLNELAGDRVGLVIFSGDAFIQCPLTTDFSAVKMFLDAIEPDVTTAAGTNLESALSVAADVLTPRHDRGTSGTYGRAVILFSDGEDHGSDFESQAERLRDMDVIVHAVGVGTDRGAPIPVLNDGGRVVEFKKAGGSVVTSRLEDSKLRAIADRTGGRYHQASATDDDVKQLYADLAQMEKAESSQYQFTEYENRFQFFLIVALALMVTESLLTTRRKGTGE